ncbi:pyridoxamine 5'-phosphate oxidase family protein [Paracoccus sp. S1E-3]|uniref:pyridoxamine 5'-phosphate oxidase family protein n=1 Tax=Paracoccus sp. S1E-3 TaxID=2756130 RepID=UPI0015EF87D7|nr:pyridoxamine 5'-phosphate oxidase family protein [Paracoccus sp. S1E-3]MBA4491239.1 pyridoxamine 5'-phosphate oxidase family protein [Paracoccus sp. S1E-3]
MTDDLRKEFRDKMKSVHTGMLQVGDDRFVPMAHNLTGEDPDLWFITAKGTPMAEAAAAGAEGCYLVCSEKHGIYADIHGKLSLSEDEAKTEEIWGIIASAWFEGGPRDPDVQLLRYRPTKAEVWLSDTGALGFLYQIAKAKMTGDKPDMGTHATLDFG